MVDENNPKYKKMRDYVAIGLLVLMGIPVNLGIERQQRHEDLEEAINPTTSYERRKYICERHMDLDSKTLIPYYKLFSKN